MNNKVKGFAAGILAAIFYGTNPLGTLPLYAEGINSSSVLFYRYSLAVVMFALVMLIRRENFAIKWGHAIRFALLGSFFAMSSATLYMSFHYMDAGIASTILFCYPIMVATLMVVFFHEHITITTTLSILMAMVGIALLYRGEGNITLSTTGLTLVILSSLLYAVYIIAVQRLNNEYSSLKFTFWIVFFGLIAIFIFSKLSNEPLQMLHSTKQWICAAQLALLPTVLSLFFITVAINNIGSTYAAIMGALEPVTAVIIGVGIFGELFTIRLATGIILILGAVMMIVVSKKEKTNKVIDK